MAIMITWNMQGGQGNMESKWTAISGRITNPAEYGLPQAPSIIFLQECSDVPNAVTPPGWGPIPGAPPAVSRYSKNFGTYNNPFCYFIVHYDWGVANNRVSFAALVRTAPNAVPANHLQISNDLSANIVVINPVAAAPGTRPMIGVTVGAATYYCMHAPSGVAAAFSRTYISGMINGAFGIGGYVIGGDFNCEPNNLYNAANPIPHGVLNTSGNPTVLPGLKEYDYFASSNMAANNTFLNNVLTTNLLSDHIGVRATY